MTAAMQREMTREMERPDDDQDDTEAHKKVIQAANKLR